MGERPNVCIDRILPRELMRLQPTARAREGRVRAIAPIGKTWMNGSKLRARFLGGTAAQQAKAREQAKRWTDVANLTIEFGNAPDAEIRISFDPSDGAWSYIGTDCRDIPLNEAMYPKTGGTAATATELKVNASTRTQASIGKFGEEDLFRFHATSSGRYVVDTRGPTDVVMKLFGPNSQTTVIAEDDDSGVDLNARIAANLIAGDYFVQVRHFNKASGVGNYSVKVAKA